MFDRWLDDWQSQYHGYLLRDRKSPQVLYIDFASFGIVWPIIVKCNNEISRDQPRS
jgi:hypothetical protein